MTAYQIATAADRRQLSDFLIREGQFLLPMVKLIEQSEAAIEEVIDVTGRATIEAILEASALEVAGAKSPGKCSGEIRWHGSQEGVAWLSDRKLRVRKPRLRHKTDGEIELPVHGALKRSGRLARRMMSILLEGVSTRKYQKVIPEMAQTLGVSKSAVSRANLQAGEKLLAELAQRRFDGLDLLIVYLDGLRLGEHHVLGAVGVDSSGQKHVLGLRQGSSENTSIVTELLQDLVSRGLDPARRRLFVIDGSKALRAGIDAVRRGGQSGPAVPHAQAEERLGSSAQGPARQRQEHAAGGVETSGGPGQTADPAARQVVREETSLGLCQFIGRLG